MKHVVVVDESGMPVYYDHRDGLMLCPIVSSLYNLMKTSFDETVKSWCCGTTRFFLKPYLPLLFMIVSDQGEGEAVLHSQLHLIHQIFLLLFGPEKLYGRKKSLDKFKGTIQRLIDTTFQLIDENQSILVQSIEVLDVNEQIKGKCTEMLGKVLHNSPGATHAMLFVGTKLVAWNFPTFNQKTQFTFNSMDMFLLILFLRTEFHPLIRQLEFTKMAIADYTDHEEVIAAAMRGDDAVNADPAEDPQAPDSEDGDEGFDTAPEDWEESYTTNRYTLSAENPIMLFQSGWLDEIFNEGARLPEDPGNATDEHPLNLTMGLRLEASQALLEALRAGLKEGDSKENDGVALLQFSLTAVGLLPAEQVIDDGNFGSTTKEAVVTFQRNNQLSATGDADPTTIVHLLKQARQVNIDASKQAKKPEVEEDKPEEESASSKSILSTPDGFTTPVKSRLRNEGGYPATPTTPRSMGIAISTPISAISNISAASSPRPTNTSTYSTPTNSVTSTPVRESSFSGTPLSQSFGTPSRVRASAHPAKSVLEQLYLQCRVRSSQHQPVWVYCAEIHEVTTLVVLNQGLKGTAEEKDRLDRSQHQFREWLRKNYAGYLIAKERTHIPILTSLHSLPGLVHYIFVNHQSNRVQAPTITPLSGQVHRDQGVTDKMLAKLRGEVWNLVHTGQHHLANGYTSMLVRKNDFTYSYRLWIVDDEGVEQVIDKSALTIMKETPIGYRFYKDLVHKLFPSQAMQLVVLELYTLYLGILPTAMVSKNDRALITMLHPQGDQ